MLISHAGIVVSIQVCSMSFGGCFLDHMRRKVLVSVVDVHNGLVKLQVDS
jgi:hypothetical protein